MDWVPIDYGEVFDKRRPFPNQKGMARALEVDFPPERKAEESYDLETTGEIFQKLFGDDEVDPEHIVEVKRIMGIKPEASPYALLAEIYAIGSEEEEKMAPRLSRDINGVQCKALCDIGAQVSVLSSKIYDKVQDHNLYLAPTIGGIRNQAFRILKIKECFSRLDSRAKGLAAKSQEPLNLFSFFRIHLSA
jgi:hypothetical protein